jgi:transposase-like protein
MRSMFRIQHWSSDLTRFEIGLRSLPLRVRRPSRALTRRGGQQIALSLYISIIRVAMDTAITELRSSSTPCVAAVARKYGLVTSTLRRRWKGMISSRDQAIEDSRFLNSQQEQQLLSHTKQLCGRCLPPIPAIMADIAAQLGGKAPGHNWCSRFVQRHKTELDSRYLHSLDLNRHEADSVASFERYFSVVGKKVEE